MNVAIYKSGSDEIEYFVFDCEKIGNKYVGTNVTISGIKPTHWQVIWTEDVASPILNEDEEIIGWDKKISELNHSMETIEVQKPSYQEYKTALLARKDISTMTYQTLDDYIETNVVDLASAKGFIKRLAKVTLALCKIIDSK